MRIDDNKWSSDKIIIKNYNTNAVLIKIKRKNFYTSTIMRKKKKQYNRNNKSVRESTETASSPGIPRGISIPRCLSATVYLEKSSSCFTRIHVTLCSRETRLSPGNWRRHMDVSVREKERERLLHEFSVRILRGRYRCSSYEKKRPPGLF